MPSSLIPLPVFHTPLSLLHDPPHEILSGQLQPYFESPERYHRILSTLRDSGAFEVVQQGWTRDDVVTEELLTAVRAVHDEDYVDFLRNVYEEWVKEGGSKVRLRSLLCTLIGRTDPLPLLLTDGSASRDVFPARSPPRADFGRDGAE